MRILHSRPDEFVDRSLRHVAVIAGHGQHVARRRAGGRFAHVAAMALLVIAGWYLCAAPTSVDVRTSLVQLPDAAEPTASAVAELVRTSAGRLDSVRADDYRDLASLMRESTIDTITGLVASGSDSASELAARLGVMLPGIEAMLEGDAVAAVDLLATYREDYDTRGTALLAMAMYAAGIPLDEVLAVANTVVDAESSDDPYLQSVVMEAFFVAARIEIQGGNFEGGLDILSTIAVTDGPAASGNLRAFSMMLGIESMVRELRK